MKTAGKVSLIFLILFIAFTQAHAGKRAIVIAVDEYKDPTIPSLKGCVNDAAGIIKVLKDSMGFADKEIKFIKNAQATRSGILNAFEEWLIKGTRVGDKIFVYFGGHGSYYWDLNGDEKDENPAVDEALCPYDTDRSLNDANKKMNMIIDDEIGEMLDRLKGRVIVMIFDSCHSGTSMKSLGNPSARIRSLNVELPPLPGNKVSSRSPRSDSRGKPSEVYALSEEIADSKSYMVLLAAASPVQKAQEINSPDGATHGALSYSIIQSFQENADIYLADIKSRFDTIRKTYQLTDQEPQIEGNPGLAQRSLKEIFDSSFMSDLAYAAENINPAITLSILANEEGKTRFRQFEKLRFHVRCSSEGYLYLFDRIESSDQMYLIYPNQWSLTRDSGKANFIGKDEEISVPPATVKGKPISFEFSADQKGKEKIIAIVTQKPWEEMDTILGKNDEPAKLMSNEQKAEILSQLYQKQSERHVEYGKDRGIPNDWGGTSLDIEIY